MRQEFRREALASFWEACHVAKQNVTKPDHIWFLGFIEDLVRAFDAAMESDVALRELEEFLRQNQQDPGPKAGATIRAIRPHVIECHGQPASDRADTGRDYLEEDIPDDRRSCNGRDRPPTAYWLSRSRLSHIVAGPSGGLLLADLGADVIKVEEPRGGDQSRAMPTAAAPSTP